VVEPSYLEFPHPNDQTNAFIKFSKRFTKHSHNIVGQQRTKHTIFIKTYSLVASSTLIMPSSIVGSAVGEELLPPSYSCVNMSNNCIWSIVATQDRIEKDLVIKLVIYNILQV